MTRKKTQSPDQNDQLEVLVRKIIVARDAKNRVRINLFEACYDTDVGGLWKNDGLFPRSNFLDWLRDRTRLGDQDRRDYKVYKTVRDLLDKERATSACEDMSIPRALTEIYNANKGTPKSRVVELYDEVYRRIRIFESKKGQKSGATRIKRIVRDAATMLGLAVSNDEKRVDYKAKYKVALATLRLIAKNQQRNNTWARRHALRAIEEELGETVDTIVDVDDREAA